MSADARAWRCPVCEGVNHGGRVCTTCGEELPEGFIPEDVAPRSSPAGETPTVVPVVRRPPPPAPPRTSVFDDIFGGGGRDRWGTPAGEAPVYDAYEPVDEPTYEPVDEPVRRPRRGTPPAATFDDVFGPS
jgi:hypothetical protein